MRRPSMPTTPRGSAGIRGSPRGAGPGAAGGGGMPDRGVPLRNVFEVVVEALAGLARDTMGEEWRRYFPLVGTIFVFIPVSNPMGLAPGVGGGARARHQTP